MKKKNKDLKDYISVREASEILNWKYHRLIRWIERDKIGLKSKGIAVKVGWNWLLHRSAINQIKNSLRSSRKKSK